MIKAVWGAAAGAAPAPRHWRAQPFQNLAAQRGVVAREGPALESGGHRGECELNQAAFRANELKRLRGRHAVQFDQASVQPKGQNDRPKLEVESAQGSRNSAQSSLTGQGDRGAANRRGALGRAGSTGDKMTAPRDSGTLGHSRRPTATLPGRIAWPNLRWN